MTNPDAVVDELMAHIEVYADERLSYNADNVALFKESLTDAIRTALLNVAEQSHYEGANSGIWMLTNLIISDRNDMPSEDDVRRIWLNSKTRAALQGDK